MDSRIAVVTESLLLLAALGFLAVGVRGLRPRMEAASAGRHLERVRASGDAEEIAEAAGDFARLRPGDASVRLIRARALLAAGRFAEARGAYAEAARLARTPKLRAAAEIGTGSALLLKFTPPASADLDAARKAFERAAASAPRVPDAQACLAVAHAWAGDLEAAEAAAKAARGTLRLEPAIALACCKAFIAASRSDHATALLEFRRAQALDPSMRTALGKYLARRVRVFELDSGARPDASVELRKKLVEHVKKEGKQGITNPDTYPLFLRAAFACALLPGEYRLGMGLLGEAVAARADDPVPLLFRSAAVARGLVPLWEKARDFAAAKRGRRSGGNPHLKEIDRRGAVLVSDISRAAELCAAMSARGAGHVSPARAKPDVPAGHSAVDRRAAPGRGARGGEAVERALGLFDYVFRWHARKAELSTSAPMRRKRELDAVAVASRADRCLGQRTRESKALAALVRSAGVFLARNSSWTKAYARFVRSLEIFPEQPELRAFVEKMRGGLEVVAVHPASPERARLSRPLVGAEFSLPGWLGDLSQYKVMASVGPKGGPRTAITPVASGTGLWYVPKKGELPEGLIEARFEVADPFARKAEATASFPVDCSAPEITSRSPEPDAVITDRQPLIRIGWKDASGLDPDSVEVALEPVRAVFHRQILVTKGRRRAGRYTGAVTWRSKSPVVPPEARTSGEIVTGAAGACPAGTFRVRVRMKDAFGRLKGDAWTFTIR